MVLFPFINNIVVKRGQIVYKTLTLFFAKSWWRQNEPDCIVKILTSSMEFGVNNQKVWNILSSDCGWELGFRESDNFFWVINKHNNPTCANRTIVNVDVYAVRIVYLEQKYLNTNNAKEMSDGFVLLYILYVGRVIDRSLQ